MKHAFTRIGTAAGLALAFAGSAHAGNQSFDVFADANSIAFATHDASPLDTGLVFTAGEAVDISASGTWNGGACGDVGPDGTGCFGTDPTTGALYYSLIGRIGTGAWFQVGSAYAGTSDGAGDLFLAFDDSDSLNNTGFVTAVVQTNGSVIPEPGSISLMMAGLGLLGVMARRRSGRG